MRPSPSKKKKKPRTLANPESKSQVPSGQEANTLSHTLAALVTELANGRRAKARCALKMERIFTVLNSAQQLSQLDNAFHALKAVGAPVAEKEAGGSEVIMSVARMPPTRAQLQMWNSPENLVRWRLSANFVHLLQADGVIQQCLRAGEIFSMGDLQPVSSLFNW